MSRGTAHEPDRQLAVSLSQVAAGKRAPAKDASAPGKSAARTAPARKRAPIKGRTGRRKNDKAWANGRGRDNGVTGTTRVTLSSLVAAARTVRPHCSCRRVKFAASCEGPRDDACHPPSASRTRWRHWSPRIFTQRGQLPGGCCGGRAPRSPGHGKEVGRTPTGMNGLAPSKLGCPPSPRFQPTIYGRLHYVGPGPTRRVASTDQPSRIVPKHTFACQAPTASAARAAGIMRRRSPEKRTRQIAINSRPSTGVL